MATTTFATSYEIQHLMVNFEGVEVSVLQQIGYNVRAALYHRFLQGQALHLTSFKDKRGSLVARYYISKKGQGSSVVITSYPLNLYENVHQRHGKSYGGKKVFAKKLPPIAEKIAERNLARYINHLAQKIERDINNA